jgi:plastocyanin
MRPHLLLLNLFLLLAAGSRAAEWHVSMFDFYFTPTNLTIATGDTVIWSNKVTRGHDTTYYDPNQPEVFLWASDLLAKDESFSFTFTNAGYFPYVCAVHFFTRPQQTGTVTVVEANVPPTISLTNLPNGAVLEPPASFTLAAEASDFDGVVTQVQFFVNGLSVGVSTGAVFSAEVSGLEVGNYVLTAIATDDDGATNGASPVTISVRERPPLDYAALRGTYAGLIMDPGETNFTTSGYLSIRISKTGSYRGWVILGGIRQNIREQFDRIGDAVLTLRRGTLTGSLRLDSDNARITGTITDGVKSSSLQLHRQPVGGLVPVLPGEYTLMVAVAPPTTVGGLLKLHMTTNGLARTRGTLGDGVSFRTRGYVSADGRLALFDSLYSGRGALLGWLNITTNGAAQGQARWFRPADSRSKFFPEGFALETPVNGIAESVQLKRGTRFRFLQNDALCSPTSSVPTVVK